MATFLRVLGMLLFVFSLLGIVGTTFALVATGSQPIPAVCVAVLVATPGMALGALLAVAGGVSEGIVTLISELRRGNELLERIAHFTRLAEVELERRDQAKASATLTRQVLARPPIATPPAGKKKADDDAFFEQIAGE